MDDSEESIGIGVESRICAERVILLISIPRGFRLYRWRPRLKGTEPCRQRPPSAFRSHAEQQFFKALAARIYGVTTKRLNEQVKRNAERLPEDFMFRLTHAETEILNRSHFATGP